MPVVNATYNTPSQQEGIFNVFVQHGQLVCCSSNGAATIHEDIICVPTVVGDQTSTTTLDAVCSMMASSGVDLQTMAQTYGVVFVFVNSDAAPAVLLALQRIAARCRETVIVVKQTCLTHGMNKATYA